MQFVKSVIYLIHREVWGYTSLTKLAYFDFSKESIALQALVPSYEFHEIIYHFTKS